MGSRGNQVGAHRVQDCQVLLDNLTCPFKSSFAVDCSNRYPPEKKRRVCIGLDEAWDCVV